MFLYAVYVQYVYQYVLLIYSRLEAVHSVKQGPNPLQQVELNHKGLVIDRPLNVQVVLIDQL